MNIKDIIKQGIEVIRETLTPEKIQEYGLSYLEVKELIEKSERIEEFLTPEIIKACKMPSSMVRDLIIKINNIEKYLTPEIVEYGMYESHITELIIKSGKIEEYLNQPELLSKMGLTKGYISNLIKERIKDLPEEEQGKYYFEGQDRYTTLNMSNVIKAMGQEEIESLLEDEERIEKYKLEHSDIINLICNTEDPEKYMKKEKREKLKITNRDIVNITIYKKMYSQILTPEKIQEYGLSYLEVAELIEKSGRIEEFLTPEIMKACKMPSSMVRDLIIKTNNIEKYLTPKIVEYGVDGYYIIDLIIKSGKIEEYLSQPELLSEMGLKKWHISKLIKERIKDLPEEEQGKYYFEGQNNMSDLNMSNVIKAMGQGKIIECLNPEILLKFGIANNADITNLIKASGQLEEFLFEGQDINDARLSFTMANVIMHLGREEIYKYITPENLYKFNIKDSKNITNLIKSTGDLESFLFEGEEINANYNFTMANIIKGLNLCPLLDKDQITILCEFDDIEIMNIIFSLEASKQKDGIYILKELSKSNSAELRKIKNEVAMQILEKEPEEYEETLRMIEEIYLTTNVPNAAKRFMVFRELHPNFFGENLGRKKDVSYGNIPSLKEKTGQERSHIIFSDLLICAIESNNRNLRDYLNIIERGNFLYEKIINGEGKIEELNESDIEILSKYRDILNTLYNESSWGRRENEKRKNTGDLEADLRELDILFEKSNPHLSHMNLADRVIKTFGYWAGINSLAQAKQIMLDAKDRAQKRNEKVGEYVELKEGDFVKGILNTRYFASMLQNGIVAKDYLGANADHDATPLDTDVEKVLAQKESFNETLNGLTTAKSFTNSSVDGKNLGTILIVFDSEDFIETRDGKGNTSQENIGRLKENRDKKEVFCNGGSAYGIRTGIGSTNIKFIIVDRYVDKLGLEIALNGFYIPIVDKTGKVIFTKEMYNEIRDKMQGLSYYDESSFELDDTARNFGTEQIAKLVDKNLEDSEIRRNKVLKLINNAIEKCGYKMSTKRVLDLVPGLIEIIDTGSTGRGTNEPGDGDFDFMVRLDKLLADKPEKFKQALRDEIGKLGIRERTEIGTGDFRYKGVKVEDLTKEVDIDLSFSERTDEIEYSTDESIKDRLNTIKKKDINEYKIVVANILLAKKMLKKAGAYKKKDGPSPEKGQIDTRGGLGAVGIENWILQNGGSFYKASKNFLDIAKTCNTLAEFQTRYAIWDFGENHLSTRKNIYPHDNFVFNLNENGFRIMKETLSKYIETIDRENLESNKKSLSDLVAEDTGILSDTPYMEAVHAILDKERIILSESQINI